MINNLNMKAVMEYVSCHKRGFVYKAMTFYDSMIKCKVIVALAHIAIACAFHSDLSSLSSFFSNY